MDSRTKRRLSAAELDALVLSALGVGMVSSEELPDGFANAVWRVGLEDGRDVVLKVGPPPDLKLLTYERDLLRTEAMVYDLAAGTGLPMPELLHAGFDDSLIGGDYLILSALDGEPWNRVALEPEKEREVRFEIGRLLAVLHSVPDSGVFGYPYAGLTGSTWREAFLVMAGALLDDAVHYATPLPLSILEIARLFHTSAPALDEIVTPRLVHFDIWPGNVFLKDGGIEALIDHERAFWGDPLADFITPTIFGEIDGDDPMLAGYHEAGGGRGLFTHTTEVRVALYRAYLDLILLVEDGPRQYPEESYARIRTLATEDLVRALEVLRRAS
ncbi:phosphotransferase [Acrocarpospora phusangensis]|uniref:Phosphotransferase n=1 Tax=Acrocarpospora phusangensis TaxID=1070424 RepID=A0A919QL30_9ACTN|nr:aminoglycoside phosphotransferase family protein [Acrocarpospora phusangensis]GIH29721.1 phosphotransferase [Acrocarpospora phusangensis]